MSKRAKKSKTPRSLAARLVTTFLVLTLTSLVIASLSVSFFFGQAILESVESRQQLVAKEAANTVTQFVQEKFSELEATIKIGDPTSDLPEKQRDTLGNLLGLVPAFRQLILFDAQDQELIRVSRLSEAESGQLVEQVEDELFLQTRQGNTYVSPVYVDDVSSEPMIVMAVPAVDVFGDFQGTLLAEVNLKFMWDVVDRMQVGETGVAYVVDRQGNLLAIRDISRVLRGENVGRLGVVGEFMRNPVSAHEAATSIVQGINDTLVVGTYVPLETPDWAVVVELPTLEAFRPGIQSILILGAIMLAVMVLVGLVAVYVARRLAAPLLDLTETAGQIAGGEMDLRAPLEGPAEVVNLAQAFNIMTAQLQELIGSLEQRVTSRTRGLRTAAEVAHATTSVLDPDELLRQTVDLIRERLDLYYVGLFLLEKEAGDTGRTFAVLRAGTGEAGQQMMAQGHRLEVGGGSMVGQCVARGQASIALDVGAEAVHFDNPLLPDTRSEMALPLVSRGRVIGAMTVQDTHEAAFDEADIAVMQTMADQVAVAIDNARLFAETQGALHEMETIHQHYMGQAWAEYSQARAIRGYQQTDSGLMPLGDEILPETWQVMAAPGPEEGEGGEGSDRQEPSPAPAFVTPLRLRGQPIGALGFQQAEGQRPWSEEEIELVQAIAQDFTLAADNIRLVDETQRRAARERIIREIADQMQRASDIQTLMRTTAEELNRTLGGSRAYVRLSTEALLQPADGNGLPDERDNGDEGVDR